MLQLLAVFHIWQQLQRPAATAGRRRDGEWAELCMCSTRRVSIASDSNSHDIGPSTPRPFLLLPGLNPSGSPTKSSVLVTGVRRLERRRHGRGQEWENKREREEGRKKKRGGGEGQTKCGSTISVKSVLYMPARLCQDRTGAGDARGGSPVLGRQFKCLRSRAKRPGGTWGIGGKGRKRSC